MSTSLSAISVNAGVAPDRNVKKFSPPTNPPSTPPTINLQKGDIVFRYVDPELFPLFQYFMHSMMYIGQGTNPSTNQLEYQFVEAHGGQGVTDKTFLSSEQIIELDKLYEYVYRVKDASSTQIENAIAFIKNRVGRPFLQINKQYKNYNPLDDKDPHSDEWYCTELVWAAYFNCNSFPRYGRGIDIDSNGGLAVFPADIQNSPNLEKIPLFSSADNDMQNMPEKINKNYDV
jgi:hypothetical protein